MDIVEAAKIYQECVLPNQSKCDNCTIKAICGYLADANIVLTEAGR
jgi:hypothetical protein